MNPADAPVAHAPYPDSDPDGVDWAALEHAYGPADDIPDLLRAAASADPAAREEALDELGSALCHQGSVGTATTAAVPFLARLAATGPPESRIRVLGLLHGAADGAGPEWPYARRAVATALPGLLPLAAAPDPAIRQAMVWLITACEEAALPLLPLLRARLDEEDDPDVRADLVTSLGLLDVSEEPREARARALLAGAPEPAVRRAAATDLLRTAPLPLPRPLVDAALDAHQAAPSDDLPQLWPSAYRPLAERLLDDPAAALRAVARGLPLAWELTENWRDQEADVLPWLAATAEDTEALCRVARVGAALPGGEPAPWLEPRVRSADPAVRVAATLAAVRLRVPGAVGLVLRLLDERPEEAATVELTPLSGPGAAVTAAVEVFGAAARPVAERVAARPCAVWLPALLPFPSLAASCLDALVRLLPASAEVLAGVPEAAPALRARAEAGDLASATALARLTGDAGPAVAAVRAEPDALARRIAAVRTALAIGPPARDLLVLVEERLRAPDRASRAAAATALWRLTGRTEDTAPVVAAALAGSAGFPAAPPLDALRALDAMRLLPSAAVAAVRHLAWSPRRVVSGFPCDGSPHPDNEVRMRARALLAAYGPDGA
jgi:hypothetical protein